WIHVQRNAAAGSVVRYPCDANSMSRPLAAHERQLDDRALAHLSLARNIHDGSDRRERLFQVAQADRGVREDRRYGAAGDATDLVVVVVLNDRPGDGERLLRHPDPDELPGELPARLHAGDDLLAQ